MGSLRYRAAAAIAGATAARIALAGPDQPWLEPSDGGGPMPAVCWVFGLIGAALMGYNALKNGDRVGTVLLSAWMGFFAGAAIGLPVSCAIR
jgi:hypothetical protein